jgi:hypothetical protein
MNILFLLQVRSMQTGVLLNFFNGVSCLGDTNFDVVLRKSIFKL